MTPFVNTVNFQLRMFLFMNGRFGKNYLFVEILFSLSKIPNMICFWNMWKHSQMCIHTYVMYKSSDFGKYILYVGIISNPTEKAKTSVAIYLFCEVYLKPVVSFKMESFILCLYLYFWLNVCKKNIQLFQVTVSLKVT